MAAKKQRLEVGQAFSRWTVIESLGTNKHHKYIAKCLCICGNVSVVTESALRGGHSKSCGCLFKEMRAEAIENIVSNLDGVKSGRLTAIKAVGTNGKSRMWECLCECGNTTQITSTALKTGRTLSCGCLKDQRIKETVTTHGMSNTGTYYSYNGMLTRCYNKQSEKYEIYGERGITVCGEWLESFENFYRDMGEKPKGMSLERVDVNGNYCKENCKWDTFSNQAFNQRKRKDNISGRVGVSNHNGKYLARLYKDKICYTLYYGESYEDAVKAREEAELKYYGYTKG